MSRVSTILLLAIGPVIQWATWASWRRMFGVRWIAKAGECYEMMVS